MWKMQKVERKAKMRDAQIGVNLGKKSWVQRAKFKRRAQIAL
jgi:hypothetical protein